MVKGVPNHAAMGEIQGEGQNPFFFAINLLHRMKWGGGMSAPATCESKQGLYHYEFYLEKIQGSHIKASFLFLLLPVLAHACTHCLKSFWPQPCLHQSRSNLAASGTMYIMVWGIGRCEDVSILVRANLSLRSVSAWLGMWHCYILREHAQPSHEEHENKRYTAKVTRKNCKESREAGTWSLLEITGWWLLYFS